MTSQIEVQVCREGEVIHTKAVNGRPVLIGRAPNNDLVLEDASWQHALLWNEDGTLWIKNLDPSTGAYIEGERIQDIASISTEALVQIGNAFEIKIAASGSAEEDGEAEGEGTGRSTPFPYRLIVDLQAPTGPEAILEDMETGRRCAIRSNNRVSVLYLLAKQISDAPDADLRDRGWCQDRDVACGVWGRNWQKQIKSHLHVLVHRIRKDIKAGGLDPWCIEKKRCHTRAFIAEVVLR